MKHKRNTSITDFWGEKAKELNTPILGKLLCRLVSSNAKRPVWGLLYTTNRALYFQTFQTSNWFSVLTGRDRADNENNRDATQEIPVGSIKRFQVRDQRSRLSRFFRQPEIIEVEWLSDSGEKNVRLFETDSDAREFIDTLMVLEK